MNIRDYIKENVLILDGAMGSLLQKSGLKAGEKSTSFHLKNPDAVKRIHIAYFDAGSNVATTNTFSANSLVYSDEELEKVIFGAVRIAREAANESKSKKEKFVMFDQGPTGKLLKPYGELDFEDAVNIFKKNFEIADRAGADFILIETMNDSYETKAALLAAKEATDLPVFVSNAYGEDGKLMTGADPQAMVAMLEGMGADAIGVNCSLGPDKLMPVIKEYLKFASVPVIFMPNAGLPKYINGVTEYDISAQDYADFMGEANRLGVNILGGCCGTSPEYISAFAGKKLKYTKPEKKTDTMVSSYTHAVILHEGDATVIGERINPTGKKKLKEALLNGDLPYILDIGIAEENEGAEILDVNAGTPGIDERKVLTDIVTELQSVSTLPLQIDTGDASALDSALRRYNGKALINSVNGKQSSMDSVFPLAKKYGGVIVALTLDEDGIPETAEGRIEIAGRIIAEAERYGIDKKDLIFDSLTMTISTDVNAAKITLDAMKGIQMLGCRTILGLSNVSFGLPRRDIINSTFYNIAKESGLAAAIFNPSADREKVDEYAKNALMGRDPSCMEYIAYATDKPEEKKTEVSDMTLDVSIRRGLKEAAKRNTEVMLKEKSGLSIINKEIIPALDEVGREFELGKLYLPQLLMSAEAATAAFDIIRLSLGKTETNDKFTCVLATVKGDIHDIGKNIVKLLLESYGYKVIDLGKDVEPERVLEAVRENGAVMVGLSALMTTTLPAMRDTVKLIKDKLPEVKVVVGGAVLTEDYAAEIHADKYSPDAMATVRYAETLNH